MNCYSQEQDRCAFINMNGKEYSVREVLVAMDLVSVGLRSDFQGMQASTNIKDCETPIPSSCKIMNEFSELDAHDTKITVVPPAVLKEKNLYRDVTYSSQEQEKCVSTIEGNGAQSPISDFLMAMVLPSLRGERDFQKPSNAKDSATSIPTQKNRVRDKRIAVPAAESTSNLHADEVPNILFPKNTGELSKTVALDMATEVVSSTVSIEDSPYRDNTRCRDRDSRRLQFASPYANMNSGTPYLVKDGVNMTAFGVPKVRRPGQVPRLPPSSCGPVRSRLEQSNKQLTAMGSVRRTVESGIPGLRTPVNTNDCLASDIAQNTRVPSKHSIVPGAVSTGNLNADGMYMASSTPEDLPLNRTEYILSVKNREKIYRSFRKWRLKRRMADKVAKRCRRWQQIYILFLEKRMIELQKRNDALVVENRILKSQCPS